MTTGASTAYNKLPRELVPVELRAALLCWYPFDIGMHALYEGDDPEAHLPILQASYAEVDTEPNAGIAYDCIIAPDWLGSAEELGAALKRYGTMLAPEGVLLLGFRNRIGLKYLCGGIDDVVTEPLQSVKKSACGSSILFSRAEMERILARSPFDGGRFHAVMPDAWFAQAVYTDEYDAQAGIHDRVFPYDPYNSPFLVREASLYDTVVKEGALTRLANHFLVECTFPSATHHAKHVTFAALSADRGERDSFTTVLYSDGTALKKALHPEGRKTLEALCKNARALQARGIEVVKQRLTPAGVEMPVIADEPLLAYLDRRLDQGRDAFLDVFAELRETILKSSPLVEVDDTEAQEQWGVNAQELGPVLECGYIDMIPYNAFHSGNGFMFYDQEFTVQRCPVGYVMFRALRYTWIHLPHAERTVPLEEAKHIFGLVGMWDACMKREDAFVGQNRNWKRYHRIYEWADIDGDACRRRCTRLLEEQRAPKHAADSSPSSGKSYGIGLLMGVFGLFHVGHLRLIRRAKEECAYLRVGVLSDELVFEFKNKKPVIPLEERMEVLAAIAEVNEVVAIEDNPSRLMEWHRRPFDCFFSGDDYEGNSYWEWEREELRKLGSDIRFFPYTQQQSSSKIRGQLG